MTNSVDQIDLPSSWQMKTIEEIVTDVQPGFASGRKDVVGGSKHLRMNNIGVDGRLNLELIRTVPKEKAKPKYQLNFGDVLFCHTNSVKLVGKIALFDIKDDEYYFSNHLTRLRCDESIILPQWLKLVLLVLWRNRYFETRCKKWVNQAAVPKTVLMSTNVPIPPLAEQKQLTDSTESISNEVLTSKKELSRIPDLTRRLRMAILSNAFRGELTKRKIIDEPASVLLQESPKSNRTGQKEGNQKSAMRLQKWEIPGSWIWTNLDTISILERGRFSHRPRNEPRFYGGSYPFIQTGDISRSGGRITSYVQTLNEDGLAISKMFKGGTVLVAIAANIADSAILAFDACATDSVVGITPYEGVATPEYIEFFMRLRKEEIEMFAPATAQKNINLRILRAIEIPLAPLNEQRRITEKIRAYLDSVNELDDYSIKALKHLKNLDQSILSRAFRGDLFTQESIDSKSG